MSALQTDPFCVACGMSAPIELVTQLTGQLPRIHVLNRPWALLGRDPRAAVRVDDPSVSMRHAFLQVLRGRLCVVELSSREGLTLDGSRIPGAFLDLGRPLFAGRCQLSVGPSPLRGADPLDPLDLPEPDHEEGRRYFEIREAGKQRAQLRMNRTLVLVGGGERCRIRLYQEAISRHHCSLVATPEGVWVVDLLSRTGTRLNGQTVQAARLKEGDVLGVGDYELHFKPALRRAEHPATPAQLAPAPELAPPLRSPARVTVLRGTSGDLLTPVESPLDDREARLIRPLVEQLTTMQQLMFDQFVQAMAMVVQMLSVTRQEQAALLREEMRHFQTATEELIRLQQQLREAKPAAPAPSLDRWQPGTWPGGDPQPGDQRPAEATPLALPGPDAEAPPQEEEVHLWLQGRIAELEGERQSSWQRLVGFLRSK